MHVLTVCPGGMDTQFQATAGVRRLEGEHLLAPAVVADRIVEALDKQQAVVVVGARAKGMDALARGAAAFGAAPPVEAPRARHALSAARVSAARGGTRRRRCRRPEAACLRGSARRSRRASIDVRGPRGPRRVGVVPRASSAARRTATGASQTTVARSPAVTSPITPQPATATIDESRSRTPNGNASTATTSTTIAHPMATIGQGGPGSDEPVSAARSTSGRTRAAPTTSASADHAPVMSARSRSRRSPNATTSDASTTAAAMHHATGATASAKPAATAAASPRICAAPAMQLGAWRELTRRGQQRDAGHRAAELLAARVQGGGRAQRDGDGRDDERGVARRGEQPERQRADQRGEEERWGARGERHGGGRERECRAPRTAPAGSTVRRPSRAVGMRPRRGAERVAETGIVEDLAPEAVGFEPVVGPLVDPGDPLRDERRHVAACVEAEAGEVDVELPRAGLVAPLEAEGAAALLAVGQRRSDQVDARRRRRSEQIAGRPRRHHQQVVERLVLHGRPLRLRRRGILAASSPRARPSPPRSSGPGDASGRPAGTGERARASAARSARRS